MQSLFKQGCGRLRQAVCIAGLAMTLALVTGGIAQGQSPPPLTVQFSSLIYTVNQSAGTATITVTLSAPAPGSVQVDYATSDGTAVAGTDYQSASGTLQFNAKDTSKQFTVSILSDPNTQESATVNLTLSNPQNAMLGTPNTAVLTIWNDGLTVQFSAATYSVNQSAGTATITVTLSAPAPGSVQVNYATSDGTAVAGTDYQSASGTLQFNTGDTSQQFTVSILSNPTAPLTTNLNLTLSNPQDASLGNPYTAMLNIWNDSGPPPTLTVQFSAATYSVNQSAGTATITVTLSAPAPGSVQVNYATSDGTAVAGTDYQSASGTLQFNTGDTSQQFTVSILSNPNAQANTTVNLTLSSPQNVSLGSPYTAVLIIWNDGGNPLNLSVTATNSGASPSGPQGTDTTITVGLSGTVNNPPSGSGIVGPTWALPGSSCGWTIQVGYNATVPNSYLPASSSNYYIYVDQASTSYPDATLTFIPLVDGYWDLTCSVYVQFINAAETTVWSGVGTEEIPLSIVQSQAPPPFTAESNPNSALALGNQFVAQINDVQVLKGWQVRYTSPGGVAATRWQYRNITTGGAWTFFNVQAAQIVQTENWVATFEVRFVRGAPAWNVFSAARRVLVGEIDTTAWQFTFNTPAAQQYVRDAGNNLWVRRPAGNAITVTGNAPLTAASPALPKFQSGIIQGLNGSTNIEIDWVAPIAWAGGTAAGTTVTFPTIMTTKPITPAKSDTFQANGFYGATVPVALGAAYVLNDIPGISIAALPVNFPRGAATTINYNITKDNSLNWAFTDWLTAFNTETSQYQPLRQRGWTLAWDTATQAGPWNIGVAGEVAAGSMTALVPPTPRVSVDLTLNQMGMKTITNPAVR